MNKTYTFLVETDESGDILHDFSFALLQTLRFKKVWDGEEYLFIKKSMGMSPSNHPVPFEKDLIPVGSLNFVFSYIEHVMGLSVENVTPLNIPSELNHAMFLKRNVMTMSKEEVLEFPFDKPKFIKSQSRYKGFLEIVEDKYDLEELTSESNEEMLLVSDVVEIENEYRVFVQMDEIVGVKQYLGGYDVSPDMKLVKQMVRMFEFSKEKPMSYTLDIGVNKNGTFLIEVHPFVSCGLYGWSDGFLRLPSMIIQGYNYFLKQAKE